MKYIIAAVLVLFLSGPAWAENYLLNGGQTSLIQYKMVQQITPAASTQKLILSYVAPQSFESPTYRQQISDLRYDFSPQPTRRQTKTDARGNKIITVTWKPATRPVKVTVSFTAANSVSLKRIHTSAPFPLETLPAEVRPYTAPSKLVDSKNHAIRTLAHKLTGSAKSQFDAVQQILTWVVDHMHYVLAPPRFDAAYSFKSGKGNCQNYSHLAAALMRASGIPVRIVNGVTLKRPYNISIGDRILTLKMAQGRHSWIEVYFPDMGWVPYDPSGTEFFVSNRFIRIEIGIDNAETGKDGIMRWSQSQGSREKPHFEESIRPTFTTDEVKLVAKKMDYGPRKLLLSPEVDALFAKIKPPPPPPPPEAVSEKTLKELRYHKPHVFGNLEFPINYDFLTTHAEPIQADDGTMVMRKNFMVETAEYVTTQGQQYAQTFILKTPLKLDRIGLALHKFNDEGQLWLEVYKDADGTPGAYVSTSHLTDLSQMKFRIGYDWVDFAFGPQPIVLSPGRYWVALGFTGGPIVNWFFSYGKPVGPQDGTRYRTMFDETWSRSLAFEFNYRVMGLTVD